MEQEKIGKNSFLDRNKEEREEIVYKKLYEEARERAKAWHRRELAGTQKEMAEYIFPDLKESEDERIRKAIRLVLIATEDEQKAFYSTHGLTRKDCTDWLEKQKDCILVPKSHLDPPGKDGEDGMKILEKQKEQKSILSEKDSTDFEIEVHEIIAQARNDSRLNDADVLKRFEEEAAFALMLKANKLMEQKEQKPSIFPPGLGEVHFNPILCEQKEQKPVDEEELSKFCEANFNAGKRVVLNNPEEYGLQKPAEWSYPYGKNETVDQLIAIAECLEMDGDCLFNGYKGKDCGKFLRELARRESENKHAEWSNEDKKFINELCGLLAAIAKDGYVGRYYVPDLVNRLKSLRPQWKPTEDQLQLLKNAEHILYVDGKHVYSNAVHEAYEYLKKL